MTDLTGPLPNWPVEMWEQILLRASVIKYEDIRRYKSRPQKTVYKILSSVCSAWREMAVGRPWFAQALRAVLTKRCNVMSALPELPVEVWEVVLLKCFLVKHRLILRAQPRPPRPERVIYEDLASICAAWRRTAVAQPWFARKIHRQLSCNRAADSPIANLLNADLQRILVKSFVLQYESVCRVTSQAESFVYDNLVSVCAAWRDAVCSSTEVRRSVKRQLVDRGNVLVKCVARLWTSEAIQSIAELDDGLYLLCKPHRDTDNPGHAFQVTSTCQGQCKILLYDTQTFAYLRDVVIDAVCFPGDLVACPVQNCLYLSDLASGRIMRISEHGNSISNWLKPELSSVASMSMTSEGLLLWLTQDPPTLSVYSHEGKLLKNISLSDIPSPQCVVETKYCNYIVSSGSEKLVRHFIIELLEDGSSIRSYGGDRGAGEGRLNCPRHLAVDFEGRVYVSDFENKRVLVLNSAFHVQKVLLEGEYDRSCRVIGLGYARGESRLHVSFQTLLPCKHQGRVDVYTIHRRSKNS